MRKLNQIKRLILPIIFLMICCNCSSSNKSFAEQKTDAFENNTKFSPAAAVNWTLIDLPIYGTKILSHENDLYVISEEGIISLNQEMKWQKLPPFRVVNSFLSKDGGLTGKSIIREKNGANKNDEYPLCSPENATFLSGNLYVFSVCEHTTQLWRVIFNEKESLVSVIDFTYHNIEADDTYVLGINDLSTSNNKVLFPSIVDKGPALLTENEKNINLKILWQGTEKEGGIISVDFVGKQGWMLLGGGKLLRSSDSGDTWQYFSNIPKAKYNANKLKFRNEQEGYIVGTDGYILSTIDGGKTWKSQIQVTNTSLYKITVNENVVAVGGSNKELLINRKNEDVWIKAETKLDGNIKDLLIYNNKLYILIEGKLYFTQL